VKNILQIDEELTKL